MKKDNHTPNQTDKLSKFWFMLSQISPPVGFFLYFKHRHQHPNKAKEALRSAIIGIPIALLGGYILNNFILA